MEDDAPVQSPRTTFATSFFNQLDHFKKLFLKYWWLPLLVAGGCEAVQWWLIKRTPPAFVSVGRMIVNVKLSIPNGNVYSEELNYFFGTQVALMQSDSVTDRVKRRLQAANAELHPVPVAIEVTLSPKTSIFNLRAVGADADYTQAYLQATIDEYIKLKKDLLANATAATQSGIVEELKQLGVTLQNSKQTLLDYQASNSVVFLQPSGGNSAADRLAILNQRLAEKKSELQMLNTLTLDQNLERFRRLQGQQNSAGSTNTPSKEEAALGPVKNGVLPDNTPANLGGFEEAYLQVKQQLLLLTAKRDALTNTLIPSALEMVDMNNQIAEQSRLLAIYKQQSEEQLKNRQHTLELEIKDLENQTSEWEAKALDLSKKLADFETLKENHQRLQAMYDQMQASLQALDANKGIGQESVAVLEPATPQGSVPLETQKHMLMAGLIGLVLGVGVLVLLNRLDDRPTSCTQIEQLFDLPVLAQIPLVPAKDKTTSVSILRPDDDRYVLIEAYRSLRSALLYKDMLKSQPPVLPKSLVITSASPNDGKSMTSANFAITLAQAGARVLLIDADLRRGGLHQHFSKAVSPGLADVLAGKCEWSKAVVPAGISNLDLLPCGQSASRPGNLFAASGKLLADIAGHYDFYIFDTAPVLVADDVLSLAPHVDGLILVIRSGFTSGRVAQAALDSLRLRRVNVIGLVFNAIHPKTSDYYHYRFKEYYQTQ